MSAATKLQYLAGLTQGLFDKLEREKFQLENELGLVWRGDAELDDFFQHVNPNTRTVSGGGVSRGSGYFHGVEDGKKIDIHRPLGGAKDRGKALPPG